MITIHGRSFDRLKWWLIALKHRRLFRRFKSRHGYPLNLASPRTFNEKIQWIKIFGRLERFAPYVDKYEVKKIR